MRDEYSAYEAIELEACDRRLDYAVLRVSPADTKRGNPLADSGLPSLERPTLRPGNGDPLNIIHHPGGDPQCVTLRRNDFIRDVGSDGCFHYLTDTRPGSSGSPVFHDGWCVIGLQIAASELAEQPGKIKGEEIKYNNEGVWMSDILANSPDHLKSEIRACQPLCFEG